MPIYHSANLNEFGGAEFNDLQLEANKCPDRTWSLCWEMVYDVFQRAYIVTHIPDDVELVITDRDLWQPKALKWLAELHSYRRDLHQAEREARFGQLTQRDITGQEEAGGVDW